MNKGVFVDLQGTLGGDPYGNITDFYFFENSKKSLKLLSSAGFLLFVITNQSQIAKGIITQQQFDDKARELKQNLKDEGIILREIYYCPHQKSDHCICRKPSPYFPLLAKEKFDLNLAECYFIGDIYRSDIVMAQNVGAHPLLVKTGKGMESLQQLNGTEEAKTTVVVEDIWAAANYIVNHGTESDK